MTLQSMSPAIIGVVFTGLAYLYCLHIRNGVLKARAADRKPAE